MRKAGLLAIVAVAAAALLIIPQRDNDPAAEAYALQALAEPNSDGETQEVTEPTYEVADQPLETNEPENWSALDSDAAAAFEVSMFRRRTETTTAPATTEASTTTAPATVPPTAKSPATTDARTTASKPKTTEATTVESSNEEQSAAPAADAATVEQASGTTETSETTPTTVEQTTTTAPPTTAAPTTAANNGFVNAGHGVFVPPILLEIRRCESGGNYQAANPYSSARGAYQFLTGSWAAYGHAARYGVSQAHLATNAQQDEAALITWQRDGTRPWNASRHCWG
ncbi:MAG: transglycosylase family protein [Acidimicrobiia bacterium]|nr:transglycosylase family protein [Acidimicrobiia bacterium]